jgi:hypothetical protein
MKDTGYGKICMEDTALRCIKRYVISCDYGKRDSEGYRQEPTGAEFRPLTIEHCEVEF